MSNPINSRHCGKCGYWREWMFFKSKHSVICRHCESVAKPGCAVCKYKSGTLSGRGWCRKCKTVDRESADRRCIECKKVRPVSGFTYPGEAPAQPCLACRPGLTVTKKCACGTSFKIGFDSRARLRTTRKCEKCAAIGKKYKAVWRDERANFGQVECECGNEKDADAEACSRCAFLDGGPLEYKVISALRMLGGSAQPKVIADALGMSLRSVLRAGVELSARGRIVRYVNSSTHEWTGNTNQCAATVYALNVPSQWNDPSFVAGTCKDTSVMTPAHKEAGQ
jgi:hypothetical protein